MYIRFTPGPAGAIGELRGTLAETRVHPRPCGAAWVGGGFAGTAAVDPRLGGATGEFHPGLQSGFIPGRAGRLWPVPAGWSLVPVHPRPSGAAGGRFTRPGTAVGSPPAVRGRRCVRLSARGPAGSTPGATDGSLGRAGMNPTEGQLFTYTFTLPDNPRKFLNHLKKGKGLLKARANTSTGTRTRDQKNTNKQSAPPAERPDAKASELSRPKQTTEDRREYYRVRNHETRTKGIQAATSEGSKTK